MIVSRGEILRALGYLTDPARVKKLDEERKNQREFSGSRTDAIELSPLAADVKELKRLISQVPDIREEKVRDIREAIEKGDYEVDPLLVAEKILGRGLVDAIGR